MQRDPVVVTDEEETTGPELVECSGRLLLLLKSFDPTETDVRKVLERKRVFVKDDVQVRRTVCRVVKDITGPVIRMDPSVLIDQIPETSCEEQAFAFIYDSIFIHWQRLPSLIIFHHEDVIVFDAEDSFGGLVVVEIVGEKRSFRILKYGPVTGKVDAVSV